MAKFDDSHIAAIINGRKEPKIVDMTETLGTSVAIKVMPDEKIDHCHVEAGRYTEASKIQGDDAKAECYTRELQRQIIWRSYMDVDAPTEKFFPSDKDVRKLDSALIHVLYEAYLEVQEEIIPDITLTEQGVQELVDALGKESGSVVLLKNFAPDTLRACVRSLASVLHEMQQTGKQLTS